MVKEGQKVNEIEKVAGRKMKSETQHEQKKFVEYCCEQYENVTNAT